MTKIGLAAELSNRRSRRGVVNMLRENSLLRWVPPPQKEGISPAALASRRRRPAALIGVAPHTLERASIFAGDDVDDSQIARSSRCPVGGLRLPILTYASSGIASKDL